MDVIRCKSKKKFDISEVGAISLTSRFGGKGVNIMGLKVVLPAQFPNSGVNVMGLKVASLAQFPNSGGVLPMHRSYDNKLFSRRSRPQQNY